MRARTVAREAALKALYQLDLRSNVPDAEVEELLTREAQADDARSYARECVKGTWSRRAEIDKEIESVAENWQLSRMAAIDRNVLRLAIYEMLFRDDIPAAVAINEAVSIAKRYSTKDSGGFVNGILDQVKSRRLGSRPGSETAASSPPAEKP